MTLAEKREKEYQESQQQIYWLEKRIDELEDQNEVLADTVNMLSPLIMENYELKRKSKENKPREHYNWCDLSAEARVENDRWFCGNCDGALAENYTYCPHCGQKLNWES
jgi:hypothetical protein